MPQALVSIAWLPALLLATARASSNGAIDANHDGVLTPKELGKAVGELQLADGVNGRDVLNAIQSALAGLTTDKTTQAPTTGKLTASKSAPRSSMPTKTASHSGTPTKAAPKHTKAAPKHTTNTPTKARAPVLAKPPSASAKPLARAVQNKSFVARDDEAFSPKGCRHGCVPYYAHFAAVDVSSHKGPVSGASTSRPVFAAVDAQSYGPPPANAWAGPEYLVEDQQTPHQRAPHEAGMGGGASFEMDGRRRFGPAPVLRPPWGDVDSFPGDEIAWQANPHQVNHMLDRGLRAVEAARDELRALYGEWYDHVAHVSSSLDAGVSAAFISDSARKGTVRRMLHAVMTSAPYTISLAGHSAVHASGNHFNQSYSHWLHDVLGAPLAAVGVQLVTRNHAMGGLSSNHRSSCFAASYGADVDAVLWDYAMTGGDRHEMDYFFKQAMQQPRRPLLVGFQRADARDLKATSGVWRMLASYAARGVHTAGVSGQISSWPAGGDVAPFATTSPEQASTLPPGLRYVHCTATNGQLLTKACGLHKYDCHCSDDYLNPKSNADKLGCKGAASWHPGWRHHRLYGHMAGALFLDMLESALLAFQHEVEVRPLPLSNDLWHLGAYFAEQQRAVDAILAAANGPCEQSPLYSRLGCNATFTCATEFLPSVGASIESLVVAANETLAHDTPPRDGVPWLLDTKWRHDLAACPASGITNVRGFFLGTVNSSWFVLRLHDVREGVFVLNSWGVSGCTHNWGDVPLGSWKTKAGREVPNNPNLELLANGNRVTALEAIGGASIARLPELAGSQTVELALRVTSAPPCQLSHILWR